MSFEWHEDWGRYLLEKDRSLETWKEYGAESGRIRAEGDWAEFLFWKEATMVSTSDRAIRLKAEDDADWVFIHGDFRTGGRDIYEKYRDQMSVSAREKSTWIKAFAQAYGDYIEKKVEAFIPKKIEKRLDQFCDIVSWLSWSMGGATPISPRKYGVQLGAKQKEPEFHTIKVTDDEIVRTARRSADQFAKSAWRRFMARETDAMFLRDVGIGGHLYPPLEWDMTAAQDALFRETSEGVADRYWSKKLREFAPPSAWKKSFMICSLYEQIWLESRKQKKAPDVSDRGGFWWRRSQERTDFDQRLRKWEEEEFATWERYGHPPPIVGRWREREKERRKAERAKQKAEKAERQPERKLKVAGA